ncbi:neuropeptide FF receptor 1-like [Tachypleus tridentatus]|uniref:neuropeptide FF receptor 1-like n=1 Tax=Tachypleus tridentatus TaxID=6853 RepID=UPI003FD6544E
MTNTGRYSNTKMTEVSLLNASMNMVEISDKSYFYADFTQLSPVYYSFIVLYLGIMTLAFLGNFLVCVTVLVNRNMHTVVNYYIVNLALCDLMIGIFVLPMKLLELTAPASWEIFNNNLCRALSFLQTVFVFASVLTLVASCLERYVAIVYPLESRIEQSKCRTIRILLAVWAVPCVVALPFLDSADARTTTLQSQFGTISRLTCFVAFSATFRRGYYTFLFITMYLLPLSLIGCTCVRISCCLLKNLPLYRQGSVRRQETNRRKKLHEMGFHALAAAHRSKITMRNAKGRLEWSKDTAVGHWSSGNAFSGVMNYASQSGILTDESGFSGY